MSNSLRRPAECRLYKEVRKTKFKDEVGEPLKVQKNGNIYTTYKNKYVKIFAKEG
jgi:hypothetical protein